jgi:hypothetical protein
MTFDTMFPSRFCKASDFIERPLIVTIKSVALEKLGDSNEIKPVVSFNDDVKPLVLNKTNAASIVNIVGSEQTDEWIGKQVELYSATTLFHGRPTPCVRVRAASVVVDDIPHSFDDEPILRTVAKKAKAAA